MKVFHQNIRGLQGNFFGVQELFESHKNIDVLTLSETHLDSSNDMDNLYKIPGYIFLRGIGNLEKGEGLLSM